MIFTEIYTNLGINFEKTSTLIVLICFQGGGGSSEPLEPPLATGVRSDCFVEGRMFSLLEKLHL